MFRKQELRNFLAEISEGAQFFKFVFNSEEKFIIDMRSQVQDKMTSEFYGKYLNEWILKFSKFTSTTWIVRQSYPRMKRLLYRKSFICGRSSRNKKPTMASNARNQDCQAKIDFKIKITNKNTAKNDPLLKQNLNLCTRIEFVHSHKVTGKEALKFLKGPADTDETFYEYIRLGYSPMMARYYHQLMVLEKYGEKSEQLTNPLINPTMSHVMYIYSKVKKEGKIAQLDFEEIMVKKKEKFGQSGGLIYYPSEDTIVVVTPTMKRVLSSINLDVVIVSSTVLSQNSIVTSFFVPSAIGALYLACILHKEQTEAAYSQAFFALKLLLEHDGNTFEPKILIIDNLIEIRSALEAIYSNSVLMTSPWSLCKQIWSWICDDVNKMDKRRRLELMTFFHAMVYAADAHAACEHYLKLKENPYVLTTQNLNEYLEKIWLNQHLHWRTGEYNDLLGLSIKIYSEFLLTKCKSFNLIAMVDVVANIIDSHFRQVIWSCIKNNSVLKTYTKFLDKSESVYLGVDVKTIAPNEYKLERRGERSRWHIKFRTDTLCCECASGMRGQLCAHLCAMINTTNIGLKIPVLNESDKSIFIAIAGEVNECQSIEDNENDEADDVINLKYEETPDENSEEEATAFNDKQTDVPTKHEASKDDYFYLEVKTERIERNDPLEEITEFNNEELLGATCSPQPMDTSVGKETFKERYEKALKAVNSEFRRLNRLFKQNANASNLSTMLRLTRELDKIRPVERVNLNNMVIELNSEAVEQPAATEQQGSDDE